MIRSGTERALLFWWSGSNRVCLTMTLRARASLHSLHLFVTQVHMRNIDFTENRTNIQMPMHKVCRYQPSSQSKKSSLIDWFNKKRKAFHLNSTSTLLPDRSARPIDKISHFMSKDHKSIILFLMGKITHVLMRMD